MSILDDIDFTFNVSIKANYIMAPETTEEECKRNYMQNKLNVLAFEYSEELKKGLIAKIKEAALKSKQ